MPERVRCAACGRDVDVLEPVHRIASTCPHCGSRILNLTAVRKGKTPVRAKDVLGVLVILVAAPCATAGTFIFLFVHAWSNIGRHDAATGTMTLLWVAGWLSLVAGGVVLTNAGGKTLVGSPGQALIAFSILMAFGISTLVFVCSTLP